MSDSSQNHLWSASPADFRKKLVKLSQVFAKNHCSVSVIFLNFVQRISMFAIPLHREVQLVIALIP